MPEKKCPAFTVCRNTGRARLVESKDAVSVALQKIDNEIVLTSPVRKPRISMRTFRRLPAGAVFVYRGRKYVKKDRTQAGPDLLNGSRGNVVAFGFDSKPRDFTRMRVRMPYIGQLDTKLVAAAF